MKDTQDTRSIEQVSFSMETDAVWSWVKRLLSSQGRIWRDERVAMPLLVAERHDAQRDESDRVVFVLILKNIKKRSRCTLPCLTPDPSEKSQGRSVLSVSYDVSIYKPVHCVKEKKRRGCRNSFRLNNLSS